MFNKEIYKEITKKDKELVSKLNYEGINFRVSKKDYCKIEVQNKICINVFCFENKVVYPVYLSDQKFSDSMDLLLISDKFKSHYVYIKDFDRYMFNKTKYKGKKYFCKNCFQRFRSEKILSEHKEDCLVLNGKQNVKLESGFISFKNYSKQTPVPFKIYADFEGILEKVDRDIECLNSISENSPIGYILEVDLEYCKKLHDSHSDYLLAPEKPKISSDVLSKYCSDIAKKYGIKVGGVNKLVQNLRDKIKYVVHYKNLQYYLSLGMKLIKVHRILKFKQSNW